MSSSSGGRGADRTARATSATPTPSLSRAANWAAAAPAADAGLLQVRKRVEFAHPLVRSAACSAAAAPDRHRVHRVLADATDAQRDPDRRAWHRARATFAPDEEVAAELERSADRAQARAGLAAAAAFLTRATDLTPLPAARTRRALAAKGLRSRGQDKQLGIGWQPQETLDAAAFDLAGQRPAAALPGRASPAVRPDRTAGRPQLAGGRTRLAVVPAGRSGRSTGGRRMPAGDCRGGRRGRSLRCGRPRPGWPADPNRPRRHAWTRPARPQPTRWRRGSPSCPSSRTTRPSGRRSRRPRASGSCRARPIRSWSTPSRRPEGRSRRQVASPLRGRGRPGAARAGLPSISLRWSMRVPRPAATCRNRR
jgi:hypothetical protein